MKKNEPQNKILITGLCKCSILLVLPSAHRDRKPLRWSCKPQVQTIKSTGAAKTTCFPSWLYLISRTSRFVSPQEAESHYDFVTKVLAVRETKSLNYNSVKPYIIWCRVWLNYSLNFAGERNGSTYHCAIGGEKNALACLYFFKPITVIVGGAK